MLHGYMVQKDIQNPDATMPLSIPILVLKNRPDEEIKHNVRINAARELPWVGKQPVNGNAAIMVGGGASVVDYVDTIRALQRGGGKIFALNGASKWLQTQGIVADYQVIADAKPQTSILVDPNAKAHLFGSQVDPLTMDAVEAPTVWHYAIPEIEELFPAERVKRGGYAMFGGAAAVGPTAMNVAYGLGHRELHVFGYDSCNKDGRTHAYSQPMNESIPIIDAEWAGKTYKSSVVMKGQASAFQPIARALNDLGCTIELYGDGLLQAMYRTKPENLTERDKYVLMWGLEQYRIVSPGEVVVEAFLKLTELDRVIDFGCGTGRASIALAKFGYEPILVDFADNCRDAEALSMPFLVADLTKRIPLRAPYGYCIDVMEHIPEKDVDTVIQNIMESAKQTFFQIATLPDRSGVLIGATLHNTVRPHEWWAEKLNQLGLKILWQNEEHCQFFVENS
jgi:SAM-dependent methyltransferase